MLYKTYGRLKGRTGKEQTATGTADRPVEASVENEDGGVRVVIIDGEARIDLLKKQSGKSYPTTHTVGLHTINIKEALAQ